MYLQGFRYAGQGNKFADYKDPVEGFASFSLFYKKPWAEGLGITVLASDFADFQEGYQVVEAQRHEMQLARAAAEAELKEIMMEQEKKV